jgi:succinate dehydrogenase / fumarate reductase cytochrome b subunit
MIWDTGRGFDLATVDRLCWGSLIASVSLTILLWIVAFLF